MNTDTPIDISLAHSVTRHSADPHGHESNVYIKDVNGTHMTITSKSANANEKMYLRTKSTAKKQENIRYYYPNGYCSLINAEKKFQQMRNNNK